MQALAEQRQGGETGIKAVQAISGEAVWRAFDEKLFDAMFTPAQIINGQTYFPDSLNPRWEMDATNIHSQAHYTGEPGMSIGALPRDPRVV